MSCCHLLFLFFLFFSFFLSFFLSLNIDCEPVSWKIVLKVLTYSFRIWFSESSKLSQNIEVVLFQNDWNAFFDKDTFPCAMLRRFMPHFNSKISNCNCYKRFWSFKWWDWRLGGGGDYNLKVEEHVTELSPFVVTLLAIESIFDQDLRKSTVFIVILNEHMFDLACHQNKIK